MMLLRTDLGFKNIGKSEKGSSISVDMGATGEAVSKSKKDHLENLMKLPGVGKATAQKLYDSGIKSPAGVNKAGKKGLADAGISAAISKKLLAAVAKTAAKKTTAKAKSAAKKTTAKVKSTAKKATSKAVAAGTIRIAYEDTDTNLADAFTKVLPAVTRNSLFDCFFY